MKERVAIYWARRDMRLLDNPALASAVAYSKKEKVSFLPLFILEDYMVRGSGKEQFGYPSRYFLSKALPRFALNFHNFTVIKGKAAQTIISLSHQFDVTVFVNEDIYTDFYTQIKKMRERGVTIKLYSDMLSISKETKTGSGNIYSVFTPFKNAVWNEFCTLKVLPKVRLDDLPLFTSSLGELQNRSIMCTEESLMATFDTSRIFCIAGSTYDIDSLISEKGNYEHWYFDEKGALKQFNSFLKHTLSDYKAQRDGLDTNGTSRMSLALAWGLVSARSLREKIQKHHKSDFVKVPTNPAIDGATHYISELIWREFYKYLLYHYPSLMDMEFQHKFRGTITWADDETARHRFLKWIQGETGYPIVDAAMMEIAKTGYMHNRARMIVASVLTKNFGVDWRWGQEYFRAMLIDLDEASNNGGWQWGASVGADPKPIRIFNPYLQAENYDKNKIYQKRFLREDYFENPPRMMIEHKEAREGALTRYGLSSAKDGLPRDY